MMVSNRQEGRYGGSFDEKLSRLSEAVDHVAPQAMVLFNRSFAATNEPKGAGIAWQIRRPGQKGDRLRPVGRYRDFGLLRLGIPLSPNDRPSQPGKTCLTQQRFI